MNKDTLRDAVVEAERFIKAANQVVFERKSSKPNGVFYWDEIVNHKEAAAAKRASLDLTRALAKMRKPS